MNDFASLGLPQQLMQRLEYNKFTTPTPIQLQAIPPALAGKDVLGSAQTGTGKTAAFAIPLIVKLLENPRGIALILTPTRELATQVVNNIKMLLDKNSTIKTALLIGGESMPTQLSQLRARPRIIVGTPGRINDHLERGSLMLNEAGFLVLDETDRMLDMGFGIQLDRIFKYLPQQRQTLMFSATIPAEIVRLSSKYLKDPVRVAVEADIAQAPKIDQQAIYVQEAEKYQKLTKELDSRTGSVIIFVKTKWGADKLADKLRRENHSTDALHGDLRQSKRDRVVAAFRAQKYRILVATDVAARGLDIPHVEHVINYDLPQCPEDYVHRIGRTGRAGASGNAVNLIAPADNLKWKAITRMLNPDQKPTNDEHRHAPRRHPSGEQRRATPRPYKGQRSGERPSGGFGGNRSPSPSGGRPAITRFNRGKSGN